MNFEVMGGGGSGLIHDWGAFWTVVCLGLVQIAVTYYSSRLSIELLPMHVSDRQRLRHRRVLMGLGLAFVLLTLSLA